MYSAQIFKKSLGERGKAALIIGKSDEMKGCRVYIPKDRIVMVTQHVRNGETLNDNQNCQLSRFLKGIVDQEELDDMGETRKRDQDIFDQKKSARLVACGNEQLFGVDYTLTFAAVMELSTVKVILVLSRRWNLPARHGDVLNAYFKAEKEPQLDVYMKDPKGMKIEMKRYGNLEQAIALEIKDEDELTIVGVYVDDLLVTGKSRDAVDKFFKEMSALEIKDLGVVNKFLGIRILLNDEVGYVLDQEVSIDLLLKEYGLETANGLRAPIVQEFNDCNSQEPEYLPVTASNGNASVKDFQSLGDSTNAQAYYGRLEVGEACFKIESWSDADFAADKSDRKSVLGCVVMIDGAVVLSSCKKHTGVSLSTMKAEFIAASQAGRELLGLRPLF
uniref:Uncharacterized protein AlNc14C29G2762 n=1 Tax=Albugo laibachii Nc14 TaxID=890382 RepID=F0W7E6_9STRA|nr:hypothetical protein HCAG_04640 [Albugo laibachii Nc14]|eukprot:CCA17046.1 hypothetical protein HCAG_04640 [Albugo laibachii Nc14]